MNKNIGRYVAIAVIAYFIVLRPMMGGGFNLSDILKNLIPGGGVSVDDSFPGQPTDSQVLTAVQPLKAKFAVLDNNEKLALASLWRELANVIALDTDNIIKSNADIREANSVAGRLMALRMKGKYPSLGADVDSAIKNVMGKNPDALDATTKKKAVELFNGLSWAAHSS